MRVWALALVLIGCNKDEEAAVALGPCDPLDPAMCALPFPSSFYLREADTPTGFQVRFAEDTLPKNRDGVQVNPALWNEKDGFGTAGPFYAYFPDLSLTGVVGHENIADYAAAEARVVLVDAETGDRVPVWAEIDQTAEEDSERLFILWPAAPLEHGRRYVVGLRGLVKTDGSAVAPSEAFLALRDGEKAGDPDVDSRAAHFDEVVFPALEGAGVPRAELQLAWDFVTVSRENSLGRMELIREDGLARFDAAGQPYRIKSVEDHDCATEPIARDLLVEMTVPYYTTADEPNVYLSRDASGMPSYQGDTQVDILVRVPCSVAQDPKPSYVLQYGHGLLGTKEEAYTGWLGRFANESEFIVVAASWKGMASEDVPAITVNLVNDPTGFAIIPERSHQGYLEQMLALRLIRGQLAQDPAMQFEDAEGAPVGVVDPERFGYYGISQGGIMGGAYVAMSPDIDRGVLGVPGAPYPLLLTRSHDFEPFFQIFKAKFTDHRDIIMMLGLMEMLWEPAEAAGWAHVMNRLPDAEIGPKQVLIQAAIHDAQVSTLGAHVMARAYGAKTVAPETRPVYGVEEAQPGFTGSAVVEWHYTDVPDEPVENTPPDKAYDTHECPRREPEGQAQIRDFLTTGVVNHYCDGVCSGLADGLCL